MKLHLVTMQSEGAFGLMRYFERGFVALGHDVRVSTVFELYQSAAAGDRRGVVAVQAERVARRVKRLTARLAGDKVVDRLISEIEDFAPDAVLVVQGDDLDPRVIDALAAKRIATFLYRADPPPHSHMAFIATIPTYRAVFTYARNDVPSWYWYGAPRVEWVPFGSDPEIHLPRPIPADRLDDLKSPIAYLASWQPHVDRWPARLLPYGLKIWGNGWYKLPAGSPVRAAWQGEGRGFYGDFTLVCGASDIVFNMVRAFNGQGHSMKTFEIPACGGFMLTNRTDDQTTIFPEGEAAEYFSTEAELIAKVERYLADAPARRRIAEQGRQIAAAHRYVERAKQMAAAIAESR